MKLFGTFLVGASVATLAACTMIDDAKTPAESYDGETSETETVSAAGESETDVSQSETETEVTESPAETEVADTPTNAELLEAILVDQPDEVKARYDARHPAETIQFFGLEPGMTVVEGLPGGGWYTKILMPYLGSDGMIVGAQYPDEIWPIIMPDISEEALARRIESSASWTDRAIEWVDPPGPEVASYSMLSAPESLYGEVDAVLFIRALHNLNRAEASNQFLSGTIAESYQLLKPGGIVGVVQHRAAESTPDDWANGGAGYLKQSYVIEAFEYAGFELVDTSEINANPKDQAGEGDFVWRLAPTLAGTKEGTPEREAMAAIGESDRMTLLFRKPG